jgi:signal transduction histidine kinase
MTSESFGNETKLFSLHITVSIPPSPLLSLMFDHDSEMRTPLNCVQIGLELILSQMDTPTKTDDSSREILESTYVGCQTAIEILNDCLSYDKLEADDMKLNLSRVTVQTLIEKCVSPFRAQVLLSTVPSLLDLFLSSLAPLFRSSTVRLVNSMCH